MKLAMLPDQLLFQEVLVLVGWIALQQLAQPRTLYMHEQEVEQLILITTVNIVVSQ